MESHSSLGRRVEIKGGDDEGQNIFSTKDLNYFHSTIH